LRGARESQAIVPPSRPARARVPVGLDADTVVTAALELIDDHGVQAFTIRTLSCRLGVSAPTIYWHVGTKAELLQAVVDRALIDQATPVPSRGPWDRRVHHFFRVVRRQLLAHPNLTGLMRSVHSGAIEYWMSEALAIMRSAGFDDEAPTYARVMLTTALGCAQSEANMRQTEYMEADPADPTGRRYRAKPDVLRDDLGADVALTTTYDVDHQYELTTSIFISGLKVELERVHAKRRRAVSEVQGRMNASQTPARRLNAARGGGPGGS
jgi:AcrR family transcriptional regulator